MTKQVQLYHFPLSGHSHRALLFANLAGIEHEVIEIDFMNGAHKQPDYLAINPAGQVPALKDGDLSLGDSNAILTYLARKYAPDWLPTDPITMARIQKFLSLAAGEIRYGPAAARVANVFGIEIDREKTTQIASWVFALLEDHLKRAEWLAANHPTIADVAIYSYTAHAPEGGIDLAPYPQIRAWITRVEALPGFVPMPVTKVGLAA